MKKNFALRIDAEVYDAIEKWAADEFRSANGQMEWMPVIVTLASDVVYTGIAVWVLTRMFNSEKVMFSK